MTVDGLAKVPENRQQAETVQRTSLDSEAKSRTPPTSIRCFISSFWHQRSEIKNRRA